ncbi:MAG: endonuclease IV, partial [Pygmaiobacter sp.]
IDFGHLNARTLGGLCDKGEFAAVLDRMADALQDERAANFHVHFSKIQYTQGGEKCHLTFEDTEFGPNFEPLLELCAERGLTPTIICESAGTQAEDARAMARYYEALRG